MIKKITDLEINKVEKILKLSFNPQRRDFIKILQSTEVLACPGSGKTTALIAKLLILAEQMPLPNNKGLCVLTHTNVAIDEIKERLGLGQSQLFRYPNFFGTIQSFIDKFLAIPGYTKLFPNKKPIRIDDDWYEERIKKKFAFWRCGGKAWIDKRREPIG